MGSHLFLMIFKIQNKEIQKLILKKEYTNTNQINIEIDVKISFTQALHRIYGYDKKEIDIISIREIINVDMTSMGTTIKEASKHILYYDKNMNDWIMRNYIDPNLNIFNTLKENETVINVFLLGKENKYLLEDKNRNHLEEQFRNLYHFKKVRISIFNYYDANGKFDINELIDICNISNNKSTILLSNSITFSELENLRKLYIKNPEINFYMNDSGNISLVKFNPGEIYFKRVNI